MFDFESAKGAPLAAAIIVILAIVLLGGISVAFQGSVHF